MKQILTFSVFEILSKVVSGLPWRTAFSDTIPKRKMFTLKDEDSVNVINCSLNGKQEENKSPNDENQEDNKCGDIEENKCPDKEENDCTNIDENKCADVKEMEKEKNKHPTKEKNTNTTD